MVEKKVKGEKLVKEAITDLDAEISKLRKDRTAFNFELKNINKGVENTQQLEKNLKERIARLGEKEARLQDRKNKLKQKSDNLTEKLSKVKTIKDQLGQV